MAKLKKLPGQAIIDGFKGVVDFYVYMGIVCARAWPRKPAGPRALAVQSKWPAFRWATSNWLELSPIIREAYIQLAQGTTMTPRDTFTKSFINGDTLYLSGV